MENKIIEVLRKHEKSINSDELKEGKLLIIWQEAQEELPEKFTKDLETMTQADVYEKYANKLISLQVEK